MGFHSHLLVLSDPMCRPNSAAILRLVPSESSVLSSALIRNHCSHSFALLLLQPSKASAMVPPLVQLRYQTLSPPLYNFVSTKYKKSNPQNTSKPATRSNNRVIDLPPLPDPNETCALLSARDDLPLDCPPHPSSLHLVWIQRRFAGTSLKTIYLPRPVNECFFWWQRVTQALIPIGSVSMNNKRKDANR